MQSYLVHINQFLSIQKGKALDSISLLYKKSSHRRLCNDSGLFFGGQVGQPDSTSDTTVFSNFAEEPKSRYWECCATSLEDAPQCHKLNPANLNVYMTNKARFSN